MIFSWDRPSDPVGGCRKRCGLGRRPAAHPSGEPRRPGQVIPAVVKGSRPAKAQSNGTQGRAHDQTKKRLAGPRGGIMQKREDRDCGESAAVTRPAERCPGIGSTRSTPRVGRDNPWGRGPGLALENGKPGSGRHRGRDDRQARKPNAGARRPRSPKSPPFRYAERPQGRHGKGRTMKTLSVRPGRSGRKSCRSVRRHGGAVAAQRSAKRPTTPPERGRRSVSTSCWLAEP